MTPQTVTCRFPHKRQPFADLLAMGCVCRIRWRDQQTVIDFATDLKVHGGSPDSVGHVCQDINTVYAKGVDLALTNAAISYDQLHVVAMAVDSMDKVRNAEMRGEPQAVAKALGTADRKIIKRLMWGVQKPLRLVNQANAMHWLQHSGLKSARAWRLKMALREVDWSQNADLCRVSLGGKHSPWPINHRKVAIYGEIDRLPFMGSCGRVYLAGRGCMLIIFIAFRCRHA